MAYGLIYNLNFSSNIEGNRAHRISILKDGHTATIGYSDNNIIGTEEPAVLIWDNSDDIYNSIMSSRLEINLYSDDTKMIDIEDILDNTDPSKYMVRFFAENQFGTLVKYWEGYLSNASYEQNISSVPVTYKLIATDLLGTLKNIYTTDGSAVIDSKPSVIKYIDNLLGFLPYSIGYRIKNDIELKPWKFSVTTSYDEMHKYQWLFPYKDGFNMYAQTADQYLRSTLKAFNSRLFLANNNWWIINNSTYPDSPTYDIYDSSGDYVSQAGGAFLKDIPDDFKLISNDLNIRYDTPIDSVEVIANRNEYTTDFDSLGLVASDVRSLSPYPNFETKVNGILFNNTDYSDDFSSIQYDPKVRSGNYAIKTQNYITGGNPTQKILDTGFVGDFQYDAGVQPTFFCSYYIQGSGSETEDFYLYYSITKQVGTASSSTKYYWNGSNWVSYLSDSSIAILNDQDHVAKTDTWNDISVPLGSGTATNTARYRVILWQPKVHAAPSTGLVINIDQAFVGRSNVIQVDTPVHTISRISGSQRKNKKYVHEFQHFYPVNFATQFKTPTITFTDVIGFSQLNRIISQQILNDNRTHVKRYNMSMYAVDKSQFLYPYNKILIDMTEFTMDNSAIIDRLTYRAKSGIYNIDMHETNQDTNVTLDTDVLGGYPVSSI